MSDAMIMWVLYDHPSDFPDDIVARKFAIAAGEVTATDETKTFASTDEAQTFFSEFGFVAIPRQDDDDPVIIASWV